MKILKLDADRRASAVLLRKSRTLFASGVIPAKSSPRQSVRIAARIDGAVLRVIHFPSPDGPKAA